MNVPEDRPQAAEEPELAELLSTHRDAFRERHAGAGELRQFFSPGRVNLMGAHLDYNGGPVMPTAIDRGTFLAIRPRGDSRIRFSSDLEAGTGEFSLDELPNARTENWFDYALGVVQELDQVARERGAHRALSGFELHFGGNLPVGAGLSSSASMCVGTALALDDIWELECPMETLVDVALQAERGFVGVQCGIMDPFAVGFSRPETLLWIDCKDASCFHLPFDARELVIAVADTGVRRELAQGEFNDRVRQCHEAFAILREHAPNAECLRDVPLEVLERHGGALSDVQRLRARHVLLEVRRTFEAREALEAGDAETFGRAMTEAHHSLRDLYEVSCPELDHLVDTAVAVPGVLGSRLTGAGFGGCAVILARRGVEEELAARLRESYRQDFGREAGVEFFRGSPGPRQTF